MKKNKSMSADTKSFLLSFLVIAIILSGYLFMSFPEETINMVADVLPKSEELIADSSFVVCHNKLVPGNGRYKIYWERAIILENQDMTISLSVDVQDGYQFMEGEQIRGEVYSQNILGIVLKHFVSETGQKFIIDNIWYANEKSEYTVTTEFIQTFSNNNPLLIYNIAAVDFDSFVIEARHNDIIIGLITSDWLQAARFSVGDVVTGTLYANDDYTELQIDVGDGCFIPVWYYFNLSNNDCFYGTFSSGVH